jgi:hypothetical protein
VIAKSHLVKTSTFYLVYCTGSGILRDISNNVFAGYEDDIPVFNRAGNKNS